MDSQITRGLTEVIVAATCAMLGLFVLFSLIPSQVLDSGSSIPNARTFPYVIGGIFTLLCLAWALSAYRNWRGTKQKADLKLLAMGLVLGVAIAAVAALIEWAGYIMGGTVAAFLVIIAIEGQRRWLMAIGFAIGIVLAFALFFEKVLNIEVPAGLLSLNSLFG